MTCCDEFANMPTPAGSGLSRRAFMARGAGLALTVYGAGMLDLFSDGIAEAAAGDPAGRVLVSIFCAGGWDAMSVLAPTGRSEYSALRPTLKIARDDSLALAEDPTLQFHPKMTGLRDLHKAGKLTVLPSIGYQDPDQSHFTSRHYWEVGELDVAKRVGWMGRYLDLHGSATNPLQGLSLDYGLSPALASASVPVAAVASPESYDFWTRNVWDDKLNDKLLNGFGALGNLATPDPALAAARNAARLSTALRSGLSAVKGVDPMTKVRVPYPQTNDGLPQRLASLAELLELGLPLKCVALEAGGYDTHDDQLATLDDDLSVLSQSLAAFQADLEARGVADRVIVHLWSEFGRRAEENGSGTDHGAGGVSMIMGTQASGKLVGEYTGIADGDLDDGNLRHSTDFRAVYKTLLEQWFGVDSADVIPDAPKFDALPLLK